MKKCTEMRVPGMCYTFSMCQGHGKIREENLFFENARFWYKKVEVGVP
jgi:hypothetical protein